LSASGRPRLVLTADAIACTRAFAAYFALIPRFSLLGAAAGTVIAEASALIAMSVALYLAMLTRAIPRQLLLVVLSAARKTGVGHG
jgi:O-antigen/teichoic acid export membrane protein